MDYNNKIIILVDDEYQELEFWYPYLRLQENNIFPIIVGNERKTYKSRLGYEVKTNCSISDIADKKFNGIIIPGGYAPDIMRRHQSMIDFVKKTYDNGGFIAAICHAIWVVISAKIISGKKATCYYGIKDDLINAGGNYVDESVVVDKRIITSRTPDDLPIFCKTILEYLKNNCEK
jgi:protease I